MRALGTAWMLLSASAMAASEEAFFESKVLPILQQRCYECHSHEKKIKGGLALDSRSGWEVGGDAGAAVHGPIAAASDNPLLLTPTPSMVVEFAPTPLPTADLSNASTMMTDVPTPEPLPAEPTVATGVITDAAGMTQVIEIAAVVTLGPRITEVPTLTPLPPPTGTPQGQAPTAAPAATAVVLPTLAPSPTAPPTPVPSPTPLPTNEPVPAATEPPAAMPMVADCGSPDAVMYNPAPGESVSGGFPIRGTANIPTGGKYRIEILRPNIPGWAFLWENYNAVRDNVLMPSFNPRLFPPGAYTLRLSLVDGAGQETNIYCAVPFNIAE